MPFKRGRAALAGDAVFLSQFIHSLISGLTIARGRRPVNAGCRPGSYDRQWHWAEAKIEGDAIVDSSPTVPEPEAARYAWQSFPAATFYNGAGLPAVPFQTDDWPGITEHRDPAT